MNEPLISVIVICYNQAVYLDDCLASVLKQTYSRWECRVVNDGSTDQTEEVALRWVAMDPRFTYIKKENGGASSARNAGLLEVKGDYIQFLDADDLLGKNKLQHQSQFFRYHGVILISGNRYVRNREVPQKTRILGKNQALPETALSMWDDVDLIDLFKLKNPFVICAPLYPKIVLDKVGYFNEELRAFEDWEFNLRCALKGFKFHHCGYAEDAQPLVRLHDHSMTTRKAEMLESRRKFNYSILSNSDYQDYFGTTAQFIDRPGFQWLQTFWRSLVPPIFLDLARRLKKALY